LPLHQPYQLIGDQRSTFVIGGHPLESTSQFRYLRLSKYRILHPRGYLELQPIFYLSIVDFPA
jgi:hypothetical protein